MFLVLTGLISQEGRSDACKEQTEKIEAQQEAGGSAFCVQLVTASLLLPLKLFCDP